MSKIIQCAIAIGSNIEPNKHISIATKTLKNSFEDVRLSSAYSSLAIGFEGENYINRVALLGTTLSLDEFIHAIKNIEQQMDPLAYRLQSRKIDLDVLLYGQACSIKDNIPHSDIKKFSFVSCLLAEVMPEGKHPIDGMPYRQLCQKLKNHPILTKVDGF